MQETYDNLKKIRSQHADKKIILATGGFDITHAGHILFFEDCKKLGDILVVGMAPDAVRRKEKGPGRPILNEHIRLKTVSSFKPVDYAFIIPEATSTHLPDHLIPILEALAPDKVATNNDARNIGDWDKIIKNLGLPTELTVLERICPAEFENISTTKIIQKIQELFEK